MTPGYSLFHGDCVAVMRVMPAESVDAIVCDPPYNLSFMGKAWDATGVAFQPGTWMAAMRLLKPGGHLLSFGGTRTSHRLTCAIEDAGFEIRDSIAWLYGSGFPKSLNVSKAIDKAAGAEREVVGVAGRSGGGRTAMNDAPGNGRAKDYLEGDYYDSTAATDAARQWEGWGTALKPAHEPIICARKPFRGTVAANVIEHGTGALNIDGCRIEGEPWSFTHSGKTSRSAGIMGNTSGAREGVAESNPSGRWPANVAMDESQAAALDEQTTHLLGAITVRRNLVGQEQNANGIYGSRKRDASADVSYGDSGGASRFMYVAKAPKAERPVVNGISHSTVKPLTLMRWLVRLVTPPGGTVLDPFCGSGTTLQAARLEGFTSIGIESEADYLPLITKRMAS